MNPDRAALMAGPPLRESYQRPAMANKWKPPARKWNQNQWDQKPREMITKPMSNSRKIEDGVKMKKKWPAEKLNNKRAQRVGPRSLVKQELLVKLPKTAEQKEKAQAREEFRKNQQAGVALRKEIKMARREGYHLVKRTARPMKEYQARYRLALIAVEQEVTKKIHNEVDDGERKNAMAFCETLGFTIENTEGTTEIKPRVLGMNGKALDLENLEKKLDAAERKSRKEKEKKLKYGDQLGGRMDLRKVPDYEKTVLIISGGHHEPGGMNGDFASFDMGENFDRPVPEDDINYNHKMRRKLNRAIRIAQVKKEDIVRARAMAHCKKIGIEPYSGFTASHKPAKLDNHRMLVDGSVENAKQECLRVQDDVAQFNELARAFRKIAKAAPQEAAAKAEQEILERLKAERLSKDLPIDDLENAKPWAEHFSEEPMRVQREKCTQEALSRKSKGKEKRFGSSSSSDGDSSDSDVNDSGSSLASEAPKSDSFKKRPRSGLDGELSQENKKVKLLGKASVSASTERSISSNQSADAPKLMESKVEKRKSKESFWTVDPPGVVMGDASEVAEKEQTEEKEVKKQKKAKTEKKEKKAKEKNVAPADNEAETAIGNDWNADALDGDAARKEKFLRLLGGKKESGSKPKSRSTHSGTADITKVQTDLEKQFQQGIALNNGNAGKRRGIGA